MLFHMKEIRASELAVNCLELLDEVEKSRS